MATLEYRPMQFVLKVRLEVPVMASLEILDPPDHLCILNQAAFVAIGGSQFCLARCCRLDWFRG